MNQIFMSKLKTRPLDGCPGKLLLERMVARELPAEREKALRKHAASCGLCQPLLAQLEAQQVAFVQSPLLERSVADVLTRLPKADAHALRAEVAPWFKPEALLREPYELTLEGVSERDGERHFEAIPEKETETVLPTGRRRAPPSIQPPQQGRYFESRHVRRALMASLGLGVVLLLGVQVQRSGLLSSGEPAEVLTRSSHRLPGPLEVFVLREGQVRAAQNGDTFWAGDKLQVTVRPGGYPFVHVFSLDAQGRLTSFYAEPDGSSLALRRDAEQLLEHAIVLDDYKGLERIFALYSDEPLPFSAVETGARAWLQHQSLPLTLDRITELPIPATTQVSFLLVKA